MIASWITGQKGPGRVDPVAPFCSCLVSLMNNGCALIMIT